MTRLLQKDVMAGLVLFAIGTYYALHSYLSYRLGDLRAIGPGALPFAAGLILAVTGLAILAIGWSKVARPDAPDMRSAAGVSFSLVAFAALIGPFGIIPAVAVQTVLAALAGSGRKVSTLVIQATLTTVLAIVVFPWLLGIRIPIIAWPL